MVHSNVWKFDKIWLSGTLIIFRKPKVWWTDEHEDPYIPQTLVERGYKNHKQICQIEQSHHPSQNKYVEVLNKFKDVLLIFISSSLDSFYFFILFSSLYFV